MLTHRQRLEKCIVGEKIDRVPVALWRHFPVDDQSPERLAKAILAFQNSFDFDLVKVTPESSFCVKDWGVQDEWHGDSEGTRRYTRRVITQPEDWLNLKALDPHSGHLGAQLEVLKLVVEQLGNDTPVLQTIFSPMHQAKNLAGNERLIVHLRQYPDAVHAGLKTIAESTLRFIEAAIATGIAGVFFAVHHAQYGMLSETEFLDFGKTYDVQVLQSTHQLWCNMLHLHGLQVMFHLATDYPVQIINWHDQETYPSLKQAREFFPGVLCGGIGREQTMLLSEPERIYQEAQSAIQQTQGERFILGTGCVVPITTPYGNLLAARRSVEM